MSLKNVSETLFDEDRAYRHLRKLAVDIGSRDSGGENERNAAEYIESEFKGLGLKTTVQEFPVQTGRVLIQRLDIIEPYREEVRCRANVLAGSTRPEGVEGELVYVDAVTEEYVTPELSGKIILTSGFYRKGLELFREVKPLGIINIVARRAALTHGWGTARLRDKYGPMPTINISYEDGLRMVKSKAKRVRLCVINEEKTGTSQNVIGELTGDSKPDEIVLVGGHYDTVPEVPGASDNAAGTAITMELAHVFREKGSRRTMRFIAWGCEEVGLLGSAYDAVRLKKESDDLKKKHSEQDITTELEKIRLVANIDVQGGVIGSNFESALGPPELSASVKLLAKELGVAFSTSGGPGTTDGVYSSDNASYSSVGIPSVSFIRGGGGGGHSVEDSIEWLSSDALGLQGRFIERFLTRYVAEAATFPFERVIPPEARQAIERYYKNRMEKPPGSD